MTGRVEDGAKACSARSPGVPVRLTAHGRNLQRPVDTPDRSSEFHHGAKGGKSPVDCRRRQAAFQHETAKVYPDLVCEPDRPVEKLIAVLLSSYFLLSYFLLLSSRTRFDSTWSISPSRPWAEAASGNCLVTATRPAGSPCRWSRIVASAMSTRSNALGSASSR